MLPCCNHAQCSGSVRHGAYFCRQEDEEQHACTTSSTLQKPLDTTHLVDPRLHKLAYWVQVMRWMEQCAYIAASRVGRGGHLLTGSMDSIIFTQPTRVGDVMYITAQVPSLLSLALHFLSGLDVLFLYILNCYIFSNEKLFLIRFYGFSTITTKRLGVPA